MKSMKIKFCITSCLLLLEIQVFANTDNKHLDALQMEFIQDHNIIQTLDQQKDLDRLELVAVEIETAWFIKDKERYGYLMLELCNAFASSDFGDDRQYELARRYSSIALKKSAMLEESEQIPLETELKLLLHVQDSFDFEEVKDSNDWSYARAEMAELYFHGWERLENAIDKNWDPNDPNLKPLSRPPGIKRWASGMSPNAIEDPILRAEYEISLERYRQEAMYHNKQYGLRDLKKYLLPYIQENLIRLYSGSSFDYSNLETQVLQSDLKALVDSNDVKEMILNGVQDRLIKIESETKTKGGLGSGKTMSEYIKQRELD